MLIFTNEEKKGFQEGIKKFIKQTNQILARSDKNTEGGKWTNNELNKAMNAIDYKYKLCYGSGHISSERTSIAFAPNSILHKELVNGKQVGLNRGIYIWFAYYYESKEYALGFAISNENGEKKAQCQAYRQMIKDNVFDNKWYEYSKLDFKKITDNFLELVNYFSKFQSDDFKIENIEYYRVDNCEFQAFDKKHISKTFHQNISLNQILYGPPGTGKTYHTINKALEIISQKDQSIDEKLRAEIEDILENLKSDSPTPDNRKKAKEIFDKFKNEEQIEFITFHQSYSYEEFVEGIKPITTEEKNVIYEPRDEIFKEICKRAVKNIEDSGKTKEELNEESNLDDKLFNFLDFYIEKQETISKAQNGNFQIQNYDDKKIYLTTNDAKEKTIPLDLSKVKKILSTKKDFKSATLMYKELFGLKNNQKATYYLQLYKEFLDFEPQNFEQQKYSDTKVNLKPYILIIDEINRGNISKIFGELITLIEPSKRLGASEELKVVLPYSGSSAEEGESKELFGVPSNLYIIGTMNTADRSITSIDTALRRRFEFEEMMPNPSKLKTLKIKKENEEGETEINLKEMLKAINERIEYLCGREKTIGHAYLIEVDSLQSLKNAFQNKIIPLLQEYFYNDYEAISAVLNDNGMIINNQDFKYTQGSFKTFTDNRGMNEKKIFRIATETDTNKESDKYIWEDPKTYIAIYNDEVSKELKEAK